MSILNETDSSSVYCDFEDDDSLTMNELPSFAIPKFPVPSSPEYSSKNPESSPIKKLLKKVRKSQSLPILESSSATTTDSDSSSLSLHSFGKSFRRVKSFLGLTKKTEEFINPYYFQRKPKLHETDFYDIESLLHFTEDLDATSAPMEWKQRYELMKQTRSSYRSQDYQAMHSIGIFSLEALQLSEDDSSSSSLFS
ncbi:hypothetical protein HYPBUDRAFT_8058 [Hyphopichia burtonii NRRL Y-1933]|uniref:Uncharacterized protein n=1 Tax=Hyphopichia burtonii NRRL Y-1933 TaxID=984485 RepID=A0A1E4RD04_9ASCO|nr:hypothetical protein HYPBUDRAFT_8058 [Hyphopichia burtonii NRRL Y-1933]ODV65131.1 hypothetical protein HYPBUDRAFT_8058 [Hyphopichia burtonii NRRL Y-1933]